jgi:hypothetical protein
VKAHLVFQNRPESVSDLFALATTVVEAVAVEEQRKRQVASVPKTVGYLLLVGSVVPAQEGPVGADLRGRCWACGEAGHLRRDCRSRPRQVPGRGRSGNAVGARL